MPDRPYVLLSCGISLDGYLDCPSVRRLRLSNDEDFDRVDAVRAGCDAILVGATTVRNDNPRLLVRSEERRRERAARGLAPSPAKVTLTVTGKLDPDADFFRAGDTEKIVYCPAPVAAELRCRLGSAATVVGLGDDVSVEHVTDDLYGRGVRRLMVEGGGTVHSQFLAHDLVDELQLVVAPLFVGDARARRFVDEGRYPWNPDRRATLAEVRQIGDVVLLRYAMSDRFDAG